MAAKGLMVIGGILDSDYEDNIYVIIRNFNQISQTLKTGQKIAQAIIVGGGWPDCLPVQVEG